MVHRIRCGGLLVDVDRRLLLALERDMLTGADLWIPPGGGLEEQDESAADCVRREMREETGLIVDVGPLVYIREFIEQSRTVHTLDLYFTVSRREGSIPTGTDRTAPPSGADLRRHVEWFRQDELTELEIRPIELIDSFWDDYDRGFPSPRYLGTIRADHIASP